MTGLVQDLSREDRAEIRLSFFREFRGDNGCTSVSVRRDKETHEWYLSVGYNGSGARIEAQTYCGLGIRKHAAPRARHAVLYRN